MNEALQRLQQEGYALVILLDRSRSDGSSDSRDVRLQAVKPRESRALVRRPPMLPATRDGAPMFQINGGDLAFLKSIGIDPTRRARTRRSARPRPDAGPRDGDS